MEWFKLEARSGDLTVKVQSSDKIFYLHSRYNPRKEAKNLVDHIEIPPFSREIIVFGIGAGYHVLEILERFPNLHVILVELNEKYAEWSQRELPTVKDLINHSRVNYIHSSGLSELKKILSDLQNNNGSDIFIFQPSTKLIVDTQIRLLIKQIRLVKNSFYLQRPILEENFNKNIEGNYPTISHYSETFNDKRIILVSAGPSLLKQMPLLKRISSSEDILIVSVGTSFNILYSYGITPHLVMIADANEAIVKQFDFDYPNQVPLFFLSTANHQAVSTYRGPKFILWQKGYNPSEKQALKTGEPLIQSGGSVATGLLDLVVKLGAKSIALVGQDLAFTDNQTHASGIQSNEIIKVTQSLIEVNDYYRQKKIYTPLNLFTYKSWFEAYALTINSNIHLWNCTEGGAYIENFIHDSLENFILNKN
jgi:hypothetical protein